MNLSALEQAEQLLEQILQSGVSELDILQQLYTFKHGLPHIRLAAPCTLQNHTIRHVSAEAAEKAVGVADATIAAGRVMKFVPASGAATRMFKALLAVINENEQLSYNDLQTRAESSSDYRFTLKFWQEREHFAFVEDLAALAEQQGLNLRDEAVANADVIPFLRLVCNAEGLNYANLPKGLIQFHRYETHSRTAFEEHITEALHYSLHRNSQGKKTARLHFTVSPEHAAAVQQHIQSVRSRYEDAETHLDIEFSQQKQSTNTVAVTPENEPFLTDDGLHFRPAGHGALLENVNDIEGDIVCIKNIDNVVPDRLKPETYRYKKILCGIAVTLQDRIFAALRHITQKTAERADLEIIADFGEQELAWHIPKPRAEYSDEEFARVLETLLNRPLRVCGMVKNEGEPGGGPFVVEAADGTTSLQIVESAQIDLNIPEQRRIFEASTHFNPVDLVCAVRNYEGKCFNLLDFRDNNTGFISLKSSNGRELKALELPGLWNGSMAHWNTVFVEVPVATFNPVKTINDLLRPEHRQEGQGEKG
ncbi:MAG: DUF4301 family protein [Candidatus Kapabacteria bacterium]|jgi:hypothetical protein|nr:DUF4301 family protein [Candidatus Kapabacteria bacterium]